MNRRDMLKGLATLPLLAVSLKAAPRVPVIYGDGIHDDAEGLTAWFNGRPVVMSDGREVGRTLTGEFRVGRTIVLNTPHRERRLMTGSTLRHSGNPSEAMLYIAADMPNVLIANCAMMGAGVGLDISLLG